MNHFLDRPITAPLSSKAPRWDTAERIGGSNIDDFYSPRKPSLPLISESSERTYLTHRSSTMSRDSRIICRSRVQRQLHQPEPSVTVSTKFSAASASSIHDAANNGDKDTARTNKRSIRQKLNLRKGFASVLKLSRREKSLSEPQLCKKLKKRAERGDWDAVRKLVLNHEFSEIDPVDEKRLKQVQRASMRRESYSVIQEETTPIPVTASRRPSYGSRSDGRRSFTGKESAAAAAVIKAALIEESIASSESSEDPEVGENILHDVCRHQPPLDVVETLLAGLRHRRRCVTTSGIDERGQTPLHVAADTGASPKVIDALVRADPCPASMGDAEGRSPLHLAVRFLANEGRYHSLSSSMAASSHHKWKGHNGKKNGISNRHQDNRTPLTPTEALEQTFQTVRILKDTMLTYPGRIDFKDEDYTGYSPLDYVIDANINKQELIQSLLRRKEPLTRSASRSIRRYNRRLTMQSSFSDDHQDINVLLQLEQDEIEARRKRLERMNARHPKETIDNALFDVFGIDQSQHAAALQASAVASKQVHDTEISLPLPEEGVTTQDGEQTQEDPVVDQHQSLTDDDIYNQHLQDYLDDFMNDFEGCDLDEYCDEDGFDILEDPSEETVDEGLAAMIAEISKHDENEVLSPVSVVVVTEENDDCFSLVSEVTAPMASRRC